MMVQAIKILIVSKIETHRKLLLFVQQYIC